MDLVHIALALGGSVCGNRVLAPGPNHSKLDRSLVVFVDAHTSKLFRVHSHAGDDWRACRDHVRNRLGIRGFEANRQFAHKPERIKPESNAEILHKREPRGGVRSIDRDLADQSAYALSIWPECGSIKETPGMVHLQKRGVNFANLPADIARALRWHPSCPWEGGRHSCLVALFTDATTGEPKAIHRTAINSVGEKIGRKVLGPMAGCVIRLWPDESVTNGIVLGEGIETTMVAATRIEHRGTRLTPAWAAGSASAMAKFPALAGIEGLTLLVDNDASGAGQKAAAECSARWTAAGQEVFRLVPKSPGTDFNDIIRGRV